MILTLTEYTQNNTIILFVFALIILVLGIYVLYTVREMKNTQTPPAFIIPEQERAKIKEPEAYCSEARSRMIGVGVICILYGIYETIEFLFIRSYAAKVIGAVGLIVLVIILFSGLSRIRTKYTS